MKTLEELFSSECLRCPGCAKCKFDDPTRSRKKIAGAGGKGVTGSMLFIRVLL